MSGTTIIKMSGTTIISRARLLVLSCALLVGAIAGGVYELTKDGTVELGQLPAGPRPFMAIFDTEQPLMPAGIETTIADAESRFGWPIPTPAASTLPSPETWYSADTNEVALRYGSTLVIQYVTWPDGIDPATSYAQQVSDWKAGYTSEIAGHPAWVVPQDAQAPGAPPVNEVYVSIGKVEVQLLGRLPLPALLELAGALS